MLKIEQLSLLTTVVIAFAALAALVLTGQAGIRQDLRAFHATLLAGQVELRKDMRAGQAELRNDMRAGQAELRNDMRAGQAELRNDLRAVEAGLRAGQAELRQDMKAGQNELRKDLRAVEAELRAGQTGIRKDLKSLEVRLAVVEQRTAGLSGDPGASADEPAPAASLDGQHHSARASLLLARAMTAAFGSTATGGPIY